MHNDDRRASLHASAGWLWGLLDRRRGRIQKPRGRRRLAVGGLHVRWQGHLSPLEWGAVPSVTTQLAVFILGLTPNPATHKSKVSIEWVIAGIDPALHRIPAGRLPPDTQVGRASDGRTRYSICPARGHSKRYQFALYGVPDSITTTPGFSGLELLREIANPNSTTEASVTGGFRASYTRRST